MTDAEILQAFLDGETPYSIMRWHMREVNHDDMTASMLALERVHTVLRERLRALLRAEAQRKRSGRPRIWPNARARNAAAVRKYQAKKKAEKRAQAT